MEGTEEIPKKDPINEDIDILRVPDNFAAHGPLGEVLPGLEKDFKMYWSQQQERIKKEKFTVLLSPEEAFAREVSFFCQAVDTISETVQAQSGAPTIVLFDADETIGRVPDTNTDIRVPGVSSAAIKTFTDEQKRAYQAKLEDEQMKDAHTRFQFRPAFKPVVAYVKEHYGDQVRFGILTTKEQTGLDTYFTHELEKIVPNAFQPDLIMSSKDGAAESLVHDVLEKQRLATAEGRRFTFEEALQGFLATHPEEKTVIQERIVNKSSSDYTYTMSDYDIKLFMMMRMLEKSRQEGVKHFAEDMSTDELDVDGHEDDDPTRDAHPGAAIMLFDDVTQDIMVGQDGSLRYVNVPRFRLPDDYY